MMPLDSRHLLYTQVAHMPPERDSVVPRPQAVAIRRFIAEHAHRFIYAARPDTEVPMMRPRTVDSAALRREQDLWRKWHEEQSAAERDLLASRSAAAQ